MASGVAVGKRSSFERRKNDFYETIDPRAIAALMPHIAPGTRFAEPCAGRGVLLDQLVSAGNVCVWASDIDPGRDDIHENDATTCGDGDIECFITNPPWTRSVLHEIIVNLSDKKPTWLLFDAAWKHTRQSIPLLPRLRRIVSVGRLRWIEGTTMSGKDDCAWYLFDRPNSGIIEFHGRAP